MSLVTLDDIRLKEHTLERHPRLASLRKQLLASQVEICVERARHITAYLRDLDHPNDGPEVRQAKKVAHYLRYKTPAVHDENLLAGSTTSKALGAPLFPEFFALTLWPELYTVSERKKNPQLLTAEEARELNEEVFPFWMERNVLEVLRARTGRTTELRLFEEMTFFLASKAGTISHTVPSYKAMLNRGLLGMVADAAEKERALEGAPDAAFYRAVRIALEGLMEHAAHLAAQLDKLALDEEDERRRAELVEMAAICRRVPANPPQSFREAVQALWLCQVGIHAENINMAMSPGRLDQVLYPYYRRDIDAGDLELGEAIDLVGCLWLKFADNVDMVPEASEYLFGGAGSVPAVTLGGVNAQGEDAVNDLTYIMLRVTELLRIRDPNVNARYHLEKNPDAYRDRVSEVVINTKAVPAIYNDITNIIALEGQGETIEHARDYAVIGCVELASAGREYAASSSIILNLVAPLELALFAGKRPGFGEEQIGPSTPAPAVMSSFNEFWEAFKTQLNWVIENAVKLNEAFGKVHQEMMPSPLLSAFTVGPMACGRDLTHGGALYNSSGATHIGFADVVDSLNAIEELVFNQGTITLEELIASTSDNFEGSNGEKLRLRLLNHAPKYGTAHPVARKNAKNLVGQLFEVYQNYTNYRGGPYRPAYWTMTNHAGLGSVSAALPSGRRAGAMFASGITPVSGAAPVLTECLNAVAELGGREVPGGWALNLKYSPEADSAAMLQNFAGTITAYFQQGGQQVQFNLMTYEMLEEARRDPKKYPELMVRVSGYSAYFNDLNEFMKEELITRTQYDLKTGMAVPLPPALKREP